MSTSVNSNKGEVSISGTCQADPIFSQPLETGNTKFIPSGLIFQME